MLGGALNPKGGHPSRADAHIVHVRAAEAPALVHVWHLQPDIILALAAGHNFGACGRTQCWRLRPNTILALAAEGQTQKQTNAWCCKRITNMGSVAGLTSFRMVQQKRRGHRTGKKPLKYTHTANSNNGREAERGGRLGLRSGVPTNRLHFVNGQPLVVRKN